MHSLAHVTLVPSCGRVHCEILDSEHANKQQQVQDLSKQGLYQDERGFWCPWLKFDLCLRLCLSTADKHQSSDGLVANIHLC